MEGNPEWFEKVCRGLEEAKESNTTNRRKTIAETERSLRVILDNSDAEQVSDAISKGLIKHVSINY